MEVAFSNISLSSFPQPCQKIRQRNAFHRTAWKTIGKRAAILAFAAYLPISSMMMTSCSCSSRQSKLESAAIGATIANVGELRQAKKMLTPASKSLAKSMPCMDFQPLYGTDCAFYWAKSICVGNFLTARQIIQEYGVAIQESDLKWKQGTGTVELSDAAFDAAAVACARQAAKKSGLGYQLMMNREFPVLYFVFSDNVLLMVYGTKTEKNGNGAEQAQQKEEKTIAEKAKNAGNFAIGAGVLALANEYGSAYEIPMLLVLGVAAGAAVVAVDAVKGAAGYAMDEIAPGRHDAEASVISMSDLVLGAKKMEMRDRNDDIVGYTDGTVSVADISTFRFHAKWGFLPADEDLTVAGKIGRTTSMGFIEVQKTSNPGEADAIGFTSYEPSLYNIKSVEPYVHWYGTANFNRIKQCLESRNVEYMLIFQPMSSNLIFLTNDNTAICMQAIDAGSSISALNEISMGEQLKYWQRENAARKQ